MADDGSKQTSVVASPFIMCEAKLSWMTSFQTDDDDDDDDDGGAGGW